MRFVWIAAVLGIARVSDAVAQTAHATWRPETATWAPSGAGLESSVVFGDSDKPGVYTIAFRLAPGAWIPPHTHRKPKQVIVLRGALKMGFGTLVDTTKVEVVEQGQAHVVPPETAHYEGASGATIVLFSGQGPLVTHWIKQPNH
jgi:quercetin dioxygenase-like cupin family protein